METENSSSLSEVACVQPPLTFPSPQQKSDFFKVRGGCTQAKAKVRVIGFDCKIQFAILKLIVTDFSAIQCIV